MTRLALPALAILLTSCASPSLPPLPESYDQPAMRRIVEAEPFVGPPLPKLIEWRASAAFPNNPHFAEMAQFYAPDQWHRIADDLFAGTNGLIQCPTPGPGSFRCGVRY